MLRGDICVLFGVASVRFRLCYVDITSCLGCASLFSDAVRVSFWVSVFCLSVVRPVYLSRCLGCCLTVSWSLSLYLSRELLVVVFCVFSECVIFSVLGLSLRVHVDLSRVALYEYACASVCICYVLRV